MPTHHPHIVHNLSLTGLLWLSLTGCAVRPIVNLAEPSLSRQQQEHATLVAIRQRGQTGDWLVIRGVHATDNLVASMTNMALSHAGVLDLAQMQVIEADGSGVHLTPLPEFIGKSARLMLIRPQWSGGEVAVARA